ncbi:outer membrane protein transport protein [Pseudomonas citronellolis]|uniref:outer membrane protein transport protein n=1 Tax=Pseudomonas citronellolis TaxID=53408 RepID=UPI0023E3784C|nr:outer membrane protein transport protein [Pseudomonas citronellolis]MDF3931654.1 outer membrane protein transport protein [Pseudomonas citronellolis]
MKTTWLKTTLALTIGAASAQALANGIAINEQSASGAGTAYAGRASSADNASVLYGNPAGLTKLKRAEVSGGIALIDAKDDISQAQGGTPGGSNKGDSVPFSAVPFAYYATPINDQFAAGIGMYVPYGLVNDYESNFAGRSLGSYSKVQVITFQPTIAYKINDRVSVGFGPTINQIKGKLQNELNTGGIPAVVGGNGQDTSVKIKGDDVALGYNIGVMVDLDDATTWGLTYHSKVDYHLDGHTSISNAPNVPLSLITGAPIPGTLGQALNGKYDAKLDITLPESVDTSITHKFDDKWTGYLGATWTRWSRLDAINVENSGMSAIGSGLGFNTISEELKWKDTWSMAVGASYQLDPQWVLRAGYAYDPSPTDNEHRNVRIPVGDRQILTLGAGWSPTPDMTIDVAYAYLWEDTAGVNQKGETLNTGLGPVALQPGYSAKYDNSAHGLTAQMTYRF